MLAYLEVQIAWTKAMCTQSRRSLTASKLQLHSHVARGCAQSETPRCVAQSSQTHVGADGRLREGGSREHPTTENVPGSWTFFVPRKALASYVHSIQGSSCNGRLNE